jgi:hypothetical protein
MSNPRPLAVGLIHVQPHVLPRERTSARVALALMVNDRGYALLETVEFGTSAARDQSALDTVRHLLAEVEVSALVVCGPVDEDVVRHLADEARAVICPLVTSSGSGPRPADE